MSDERNTAHYTVSVTIDIPVTMDTEEKTPGWPPKPVELVRPILHDVEEMLRRPQALADFLLKYEERDRHERGLMTFAEIQPRDDLAGPTVRNVEVFDSEGLRVAAAGDEV